MKTKLLAVLMVLIFCGCSTAPVTQPEKMSEALTRFKYYRPFPFCISEAGNPIGAYPDVDYVAFSDSGGDLGLAEAMAFFWNCESISFTPSGGISDPYVDSFQHVYSAPFPDEDGITAYYAIFGGIELLEFDSPAVQPNARVCDDGGDFSDKTVAFHVLIEYVREVPLGENGSVLCLIRFVSDEWRLYYRIVFNVGAGPGLILCNPNYGTVNLDPSVYTPDISGTVNVFGKTLDWQSYARNGYVIDGVPNLSATSTSFTYPAP